jgi:hypothetical protein
MIKILIGNFNISFIITYLLNTLLTNAEYSETLSETLGNGTSKIEPATLPLSEL